ncbi:hypothetical protein B1L11_39135 [Microbispora sp. GKU 823]|nr:hypothetical protein B1L11_39135 [Microbispora sp. GKU 823]
MLRRRAVMLRRTQRVTGLADSAETAVLIGESRRQVLLALARLPRRQREALVLRYYLDLADSEIALVMGVGQSRGLAIAAAALAVTGTIVGVARLAEPSGPRGGRRRRDVAERRRGHVQLGRRLGLPLYGSLPLPALQGRRGHRLGTGEHQPNSPGPPRREDRDVRGPADGVRELPQKRDEPPAAEGDHGRGHGGILPPETRPRRRPPGRGQGGERPARRVQRRRRRVPEGQPDPAGGSPETMRLPGQGTLSAYGRREGHGRERPCPSWPYWMSGPRFPSAHGSQSSLEDRIMGRL